MYFRVGQQHSTVTVTFFKPFAESRYRKRWLACATIHQGDSHPADELPDVKMEAGLAPVSPSVCGTVALRVWV